MNTYEFGSGNLFFVPQAGSSFATANPTPYEFATLQDVSIDMSQSIKELYGKLRSPVAVASTEMKTTGKAKFARFNAAVFNLLWGGSFVTGGQKTMAVSSVTGMPGEAVTPAAGTFTVAHNGANTYQADLGVMDTVTGLMMTKVANNTSPAAGQYHLDANSTGIYTVNANDTNPKLVYYVWAANNTTGTYIKIPNLPMGSNPTFGMYLYNNQWQGQNFMLELYSCMSSKITLGWKNTDFLVPELDFSYWDNGLGYIGEVHCDSLG